MKVELTEEGYTLDGKWKLVPVEPTLEMYANILFDGDIDMAIKKQNVCSEYGYDYKDILRFSPKPDLSDLQSVKGIHVGGELLPEFNSDNGIHY